MPDFLEPVTAAPPRAVRLPVLTMAWLDLAFLHWPVDPGLLAPLMPRGVRPDLFEGVSYVGLVAFRMSRVRPFGLLPMPYLGSFGEINVRLYSAGPDGRRGVVFRSLDAGRLLPALTGRVGLGLAYRWSKIQICRNADLVSYSGTRRWPGPAGTRLRLRLRAGEPIAEPSALEHFLTARWGLHQSWHTGHTFYLPNSHPRWQLHRAELLDLADDLVPAAGLPRPAGGPVSVLYSPGVPVRAGLARPLRR
jgi:uncharacterized protein